MKLELSLRNSVVEAFKSALANDAPTTTGDWFRSGFEERVARYGDRLFEHVSESARTCAEFDKRLFDTLDLTAGPGSLHLEFGTWTAWPDSRVDAYVRDYRVGDLIRLDYEPAHRPDIAASAMMMPLASDSLDRVSSNAVLEHIPYPDRVIRECHRILKPGGAFLCSVPFHFVEHGCPGDYVRFTGEYFRQVCADAGFVEVTVDTVSSSGVFYTVHNLAKAALVAPHVDHERRLLLEKAFKGVLEILAGMTAFDDEMLGEGRSHYHSVRVVALKAGEYVPSTTPIDRSLPFLDRHLAKLASPVSGVPLTLQGDALATADGSERFPLIEGRPDLRAEYRPTR